MSTATAPPKPARMTIDVDAIPAELKQLNRWLVWRWKWTGEKYDKPPLQVNGKNAKSNDPSTWTTFDAVVAALPKFDGIGFTLRDSGIVGIDLDDCRDPETGVISEPAASIIWAANTYAEVSPSRTGVKMLVHAKLPAKRKKVNHDLNVEVYDRQYFTITGNRVPGTPATINDRQTEIEWVLNTYVDAAKSTHENSESHTGRDRNATDGMSDIETARSALAAISNSGDGLGYDDWLRVGMALHSVSSDLLGEWLRWSQQSSKYVEAECSKKWASFNGCGDVKIGTLIHMAKQTGWKPPRNTNGSNQHKQEGESNDSASLPSDEAAAFITNFVSDVDENGRKIRIPLTMDSVIRQVHRTMKDWPRRVDTALFVDDPDYGIGWFTDTPQLFGWLKRHATVTWATGIGFVLQSELFAELRRTSTKYVGVENLPHQPLISGHYYTCRSYDAGDGHTLRNLIARFNPETSLDADLIQAAFMTPGWGGPAGCRPCFVITSDDGRGVGKSTLASMIGLLWGGVLQFSHNEDANKIKTRLLSADALTKRVSLLDNVKSLKFSWAELEGMITAPEIGGYRLYVGEATRPNTLTWFITLNGASLSTDMAQRSIIIKIRKPKRKGTWEEDTRQFIETHREALLSDVIGALRGERFALEAFSRWATWEKDVLQRLPEPSEAQRIILERQSTVDVEEEEAGILEDFFRDRLGELNYRPADDRVFLPSMVSTEWFNVVHNDRKSTISVSRIITQLINEQRIRRLDVCGRSWGRGFVWVGENCRPDDVVKTDLDERLARRRRDG